MSGPSDGRTSGQLALMDAMVFFAASIVISSAILSQTFREDLSATDASVQETLPDPASLLAILLRTSIGTELVLDFGKGFVVHPDTTVGEVLSVEVPALSSGVDEIVFSGLNREILSIAELASGPNVVPHLWIMECVEGAWMALTCIEENDPSGADTRAASFDMPSEGGSRCMVTLVLEPASLRP